VAQAERDIAAAKKKADQKQYRLKQEANRKKEQKKALEEEAPTHA